MKLTDITTSLELARELKEVGFPQDTYFYLSKNMDLIHWRVENREFYKVDLRSDIAAPTAEELLEVLQRYLPNEYLVRVSERELINKLLTTVEGWLYNKDLTNDLARLVILLAKNKIIKFEREI